MAWVLLLVAADPLSALEATVGQGTPVRVRVGGEATFQVSISNPTTVPTVATFGAFRDPSVASGTRPAHPFGFAQIRDAGCHHDGSVDFLPLPNFSGWFGVAGMTAGELRVCNVVVGASPDAVPGAYRATLDGFGDSVEFQVIVVPGETVAVPAFGIATLTALALLLLLFAGGAARARGTAPMRRG